MAHPVGVQATVEGTLPPHAFAILLVYFLQQQSKPVLPCIHSYLEPRTEETVYTTPLEVKCRHPDKVFRLFY